MKPPLVLLVLALLTSASARAGDRQLERPLRIDQLAATVSPSGEYARKAEVLRLETIRRLEALLAEANATPTPPERE